jgi:DNA-directed RNA polymerase subunit RPC12/RpoP
MTMPKKKVTKKTEICIDCGEKTKNFYIISINSGKIIRCANCHERNIIQSVRFDTKFMDSQQINKMRQ